MSGPTVQEPADWERADWEREGARARPGEPRDRTPVPGALRAATWIGVLLLVAAGIVLSVAAVLVAGDEESEAHLLFRVLLLSGVAIALGVVGVVALLLRLVASAVVRS